MIDTIVLSSVFWLLFFLLFDKYSEFYVDECDIIKILA
jgi:hypothetical protein